jgi:hypothetical protein
VILPPYPEAQAIAEDTLARLRGQTRADLLAYEKAETSEVQGPSGVNYEVRVYAFFDSDDPDSDFFLTVRVRPPGSPMRRPAKHGLTVDAEGNLWERREIAGRVPPSREPQRHGWRTTGASTKSERDPRLIPADSRTAPMILIPLGGVPERLNGAVSKTVVGLTVHRGFESLPLR